VYAVTTSAQTVSPTGAWSAMVCRLINFTDDDEKGAGGGIQLNVVDASSSGDSTDGHGNLLEPEPIIVEVARTEFAAVMQVYFQPDNNHRIIACHGAQVCVVSYEEGSGGWVPLLSSFLSFFLSFFHSFILYVHFSYSRLILSRFLPCSPPAFPYSSPSPSPSTLGRRRTPCILGYDDDRGE